MTRSRILIAFLVALFVSGCGTTQIGADKPGATQADFSNALLECRGVAKSLTGNSTDTDAVVACLEGRGWQNVRFRTVK
jgi:hypothetical protein